MEFPVDRPVVRLGRGSTNEIVLQDTQSSRQHAEISQQGDRFTIRDLGSTNGTFVNNERLTAPRVLQPGDQIRIGDTTLACQTAIPVGAAGVSDAWESQLWADDTEAQPAEGRNKVLVWGLVGLVVVLVIAIGVVVALLLTGDDGTATPVVIAPTEAATEAIEVAPTATTETRVEAPPTETPLVELPTTEALPTVELEPTLPPTKAPVAPPAPKPPAGVPTSPEQLEQLPAAVTEYLGDVPPEQLPDVIAAQMQTMQPEQIQEMIGALFPGVEIADLPGVVAASFPGLSEQEIQGMLGMVFPGQSMELPAMGPVGGRIAMGIYEASRNQYDLYVANAVGGQPTLLAENATDPSFSPDGAWIVYHSAAPDKAGLRIMRSDGSGDKALTSISSDRNPRISPDGTKILYSNVDNNTLHVINLDGSGRRDIGSGKYPDWSPDGSQIVFQGCVGGGRCGLIVANADGSNAYQITTHANDSMPRWRYGNVAFLSDRDGNFEIYVINPDGTWLRRITQNPATDIMPVWDPNGVRIAFRSDRGGDPAVYTTSGIGGGDFKQFSAAFGADWMLAGMDWGN